MATKADLIAELALLKRKLAERDSAASPEPKIAPEPPPAAATNDADADLTTWLAGHGVDTDEAKRMLQNLTKELDALAHDKPLLTAGAAFGLGVLVGRMSK